MRHLSVIAILFVLFFNVSGCKKADDKDPRAAPAIDLVPQREQLQKAKDLEKKIQQDAEEQRKVIELQTK